MTRALTASHEVSGAAYLPAPSLPAALAQCSYVSQAGTSRSPRLRVEGPGAFG